MNVTQRAQRGAWHVIAPEGAIVRQAVRTRLDETEDEPVALTHDGHIAIVAFDARPREVITILVR